MKYWLLVAAVASFAQRIERTVEVKLDHSLDMSRDRWVNGFLTGFSRGQDPSVWLYDRTGKQLILNTPIVLPQYSKINIRAVTASPRGELFVSAEAWGVGGGAGAILLRVVPPGKIDKVIDANRFVARAMTIKDKRLWLFGAPLIDGNIRNADYTTVRSYDSTSLNLLTDTMPRAQFQKPFVPSAQDPAILALPNSILIFDQSWHELDTDGKAKRHFKTESSAPWQIVATPQGRVYGALRNKGVFELDLAAARWIQKADRIDGFAGLYGHEQESLIYRSGCCTYGWLSPPER
ncbi:MAG: hypothetical protein FJW32_08095 [Acidobacteria bacterium]|nr:hypothetical protein [Acidobacteriota bacterium]